jgi:hypothetical protein
MLSEDWSANLKPGEELRWIGHSQSEYIAEGRYKAIALSAGLCVASLFFALHFESAADACASNRYFKCSVFYTFAWPCAFFFGWHAFWLYFVLIAHSKGWVQFCYAITNRRVLKRTLTHRFIWWPRLQAANISALTYVDQETALSFLSSWKWAVVVFGGLPYGDVILAREAFKSAKNELSP